MAAASIQTLEQLMDQYSVPSSGKSLSGHFDAIETLELTQTAHSRGRSVSEIIVAATKLTMGQLSAAKLAKLIRQRRADNGLNTRVSEQLSTAQKRELGELKIPLKGKTLTGHFSPHDAVDILQLLERLRKTHNDEFSISEFLVAMTISGLPAAKEFYPAIQ